MRKDSEIRKMTVLGNEWEIEIDYRNEEAEVSVLSDGEDIKVDKVTPYDLLIIAHRLSDIAQELEKEGELWEK